MSGTRHFRNPVQMNRLKDGKTESHLHNGESALNSNWNEESEAATVCPSKSQHFEERKNAKKKSDMTLEDMYNSNYEFEDDEDNDSDWEPAMPARNVLEIPKWFCLNCTITNFGTNIHCDLCGEHRESGVVKHGFLAPPFSQAQGLTGNESDAIDRPKDLLLKSIAAENTTAIGFDERMLLHEEVEMKSRPHVERPDRLRAIAASLAASGIFPGRCYPISAREITHEELLMVHSPENIEAVELTSHMFSSYFTPDTYANQYSACAARLAAGLCSDLATAICSGNAKNGFALVRPPGHHAGVKQAMGFCLHNNAAIAASAAQRAGAKKVLIIDWDVHHGNGTQEIFEKNKSVLYISLHRHEDGKFYPGTGAADEVGTMGAEGYCVNVPWSRGGVGDNDYIFAFEKVVIPIASGFDPDFTIISAGFDAARGDPLGCCDVTPTGYGRMTQMCNALSGGKLLVILEGGYNLRSISSSATAVIKVLLGDAPEHDVEQVVPSKAGLRTVLEVLKIQTKYWTLLEPKFLKLQSEWGRYTLPDKSKMFDLNRIIAKRDKNPSNPGALFSTRQPPRGASDHPGASSSAHQPPTGAGKGSQPFRLKSKSIVGGSADSSSRAKSKDPLPPAKRPKPAGAEIRQGKGKPLCPHLLEMDPTHNLWHHPELGTKVWRHALRDADMEYLMPKPVEELVNLACCDIAKLPAVLEALRIKAGGYEDMRSKAEGLEVRCAILTRELSQLRLDMDSTRKHLEEELAGVRRDLATEQSSARTYLDSLGGQRYMKARDEAAVVEYKKSGAYTADLEKAVLEYKKSKAFTSDLEEFSVPMFDECLTFFRERLVNSGRFPGETFEFLDPSYVEMIEVPPTGNASADCASQGTRLLTISEANDDTAVGEGDENVGS